MLCVVYGIVTDRCKHVKSQRKKSNDRDGEIQKKREEDAFYKLNLICWKYDVLSVIVYFISKPKLMHYSLLLVLFFRTSAFMRAFSI